MPINWHRATQDTWCGSCSEVIKRGDPLAVVHLPQVQRQRIRCPECAGVPIDQAQLDAHDQQVAQTVPRVQTWSSTHDLARDVKLRQAGKDE